MIPEPTTPDQRVRRLIADKSSADSRLCWTCGTCDLECPVYIRTQRLNPQRIVRLANLGLLDELLNDSEIWYCQMCRRCHRVCPQAVKPHEIIAFIRGESILRGIVSPEMTAQLQDLLARFQRVRWRAAEACQAGELESLSAEKWRRWLETPVHDEPAPIKAGRSASAQPAGQAASAFDARACYTCSECSGCCPIYSQRPVFDPQYIIRMANLGLTQELVRSPSIWLCLQCELCAAACSQNVRGSSVIRDVQRLALETGAVDPDYPERLLRADRLIYPRFIRAVDQLLKTFGRLA